MQFNATLFGDDLVRGLFEGLRKELPSLLSLVDKLVTDRVSQINVTELLESYSEQCGKADIASHFNFTHLAAPLFSEVQAQTNLLINALAAETDRAFQQSARHVSQTFLCYFVIPSCLAIGGTVALTLYCKQRLQKASK